MTVTKINQHGPDSFEIYIDNEKLGLLQDNDILALGISEGDEISESKRLEILYFSDVYAAKLAASRLAARRMYSRAEMQKKLVLKGFSENAAEGAAIWLEKTGLINDNIYLEKYIKDAARLKKTGKHRIVCELYEKGFEKEDVLKSLEYYNEDLLNSALYFAEKAKNKIKEDTNELLKLKRRLYQRGFDALEIDAAVKAVLEKDE